MTYSFLTHLFVQPTFAQAGPPGAGGMQLLIIVFMFAGMYFLVIAPQRKKQKQHEKMVSELKSGAKVVTAGGIYGTIVNVKKDRFSIKISENTKIEVTKQSVATVLDAEDTKD